ncbi:MAG: polymerase sigma-54 factor [Thermosediminibacterales bacterium]|nr:polymerase sigma-54 factor [Thermosediminibacterales bacterium]
MRMTYGLSLEQTQKLIMTPELRQAITILQLSSLELSEYIEQELLNNPILELKETDEEFESLNKTQETNEIDWEDYFQEHYDPGFAKSFREIKEDYSYENFVTKGPTLQEHLLFQLHLTNISERYREIGEFIIGCLDRNGYLTYSTDDIVKHLNVKPTEVEEVIGLIQTFDPAGVGARNLQECLLIQINQRGIKNHNLELLVKHYLDELAHARYTKIAEALNISLKEVQELRDILHTLEPKPGRNFHDINETQYITPDAIVEKVGDEYIVVINDTTAPRLRINNFYKSLLSMESKESSTSKFLVNKFESALWLIKSIEQRRMTLYKVVKSIVDIQRDFLDYGVRHLKPLTLKDIADLIGVHESTVSRATNGKYVQTPRGVFELKYFFTSSIDRVNGSATSSESIKKMLVDFIKQEDSHKPYSDQKLAEMFKARGIVISRRTIAKYRDELNIPPSTKRKRF